MEPEDVTFQFIREITDNFSEEKKIGEGAFGVVYKGVTKNGEDVAVKKLKLCDANLNDKHFQNELDNLRKLEHQNIVQILGYCYETEKKPSILPDGSKVYFEETYRALCFEYLDNGSLQKHLSDQFCGLDWHIRFKIIKGTCEGLKYMHQALEAPIYHLDIKPDNILLDKDMVPKLADFGLSRIFGKELAWTTENAYGTLGYQPPEYINEGEVSGKFDIFSLGVVMIRIVSGPKGYPKCLESSDAFIDKVRETWRDRLQATCSSDSLLKAYYHQVETCTQIALSCLDQDSKRRPDIVKITEKLCEIETGIIKLPHNECCMTMQNNKIEMRKEPIDITSQHQNIKLMSIPSFDDLEFDSAQETSSDVVEELIVGRTEEKQKLVASLLKGIPTRITILPIHGIAGIGKTTFAGMIYNGPEFNYYSKVWVHVSEIFDLSKICESIISQLSEKEIQANEIKMIDNSLKRLLSGKKIMIVLDDLWEDNQFKLQELKDMLYHDDSNIIVLVTTRSEQVAERICTNVQPYKISHLTDEMCWDIINQRSGFEARGDKEQLISVGHEIAQKCGGVPLAARSLGFTLRSMNFDQWKRLKDNDIWNETISKDMSLPNHVLASLMLSYSYMDLCLKPCFTYCGIFPKGHKIVKNDLIYQWMSLDFIKPTKLLSNKQLCEKYIVQLLGLSFFQHSMSPKISGAYREVISFTMHDLVHDLARSVMGDKILDASKQVNTRKSCCIYALLNDCSKPLDSSLNSPDSLRALRFLQCGKVELFGTAFSPAKSLSVLDLSECCIQMLPDSIGQLEQLRYLNAPGIQDQTIPNCITGLSKLIYFSIQGSSAISELPVSTFSKMKNLMYLDLSGCSEIQKLPESFGNLKALVHLDLSNCSQVTGVSAYLGNLTDLQYLNLSYCRNIGNLPGALSSLSEVRYLNLSCSSYLEEHPEGHVFSSLTKLEYLNLSSEIHSSLKTLPEHLGNFYQLKYLNLSGCVYLEELPMSLEKLKNLVHLDLKYCSEVHYGTLKALGGLTSLKFLNMQGCVIDGVGLDHLLEDLTELRYLNLSQCNLGNDHQMQSFIDHISALSNLEHLDLSYSSNDFTSLPECLGNLKKLHTLKISGWHELKELPTSIQNVEGLKFLVADDCDELQYSGQSQAKSHFGWLPIFTVHVVDQSKSNLVVLQDANLTIAELKIHSLENVMSTQEARAVELRKNDSITTLTLNWTPYAKRFVRDKEVLSELVPPVTLLRFTIQGYCGARFPRWVMDIPEYLPNIVEIDMDSLAKCTTLPPLGKLPNLETLHIGGMDNLKRIDKRFYGGARAFPKLKELHIWSMQSLEEWDTMCSHCHRGDGEEEEELVFPSLESLEVTCCPKLRLSACPPRAERWCITESDNVLLSGEPCTASYSPTVLRNLNVQVASSQVPLRQWRLLHYLPAITSLEIIRCSYLSTCTPEIMQDLSSLQSLSLQGDDMPVRIRRIGRHTCVIREELPKWLGELRSLKILEISGYKDIEAPVEIMEQLCSLESLTVQRCDGMRRLPQWLGALTSLQKFAIRQMPQLKNLHDSMRHLISLKSLEVWDCPKIPFLPEWLGDLSSLEQLEINDCSRIKCLPESMRRLTKLKELDISGAKKIQVLPEWLWDFSALQELHINRCSRINSLPESIQRLTKLSDLRTHGCPGLDRWRGLYELNNKLPDIKACCESNVFLGIEPPEIRLPFEVMKLVSCSLTLTNKTENCIAYALRPTEPCMYFTLPNSMGIVSPRSVCNLTVLLLAQKEVPPGMQCDDKFIVQAVRVSDPNNITEDMFDQNTNDVTVDEVYLKVTYVAVAPYHPLTSLNDESSEDPHSQPGTDNQKCQSGNMDD